MILFDLVPVWGLSISWENAQPSWVFGPCCTSSKWNALKKYCVSPFTKIHLHMFSEENSTQKFPQPKLWLKIYTKKLLVRISQDACLPSQQKDSLFFVFFGKTYNRIIAHVCMCHVTCEWVMAHMRTCLTHVWQTLHQNCTYIAQAQVYTYACICTNVSVSVHMCTCWGVYMQRVMWCVYKCAWELLHKIVRTLQEHTCIHVSVSVHTCTS